MAEIMDIREALSWIKQNELSNVLLESDCLPMVQAMRSTSRAFHIWEDCLTNSDICWQSCITKTFCLDLLNGLRTKPLIS